MTEILGFGIAPALEHYNIQAKMTFQNERFEVWELDEQNFKKLCDIPDADWASNFGWWRYGHCILDDNRCETCEYTVNGNKMLGWLPDDNYHDAGYYRDNKYDSFTDWLSLVWNCSTERHIACFAISLAEKNNLTLAEFMCQFQLSR